ncbi:MAG: hypothetical protein K6T75_04435 [Acetobacteraceae bacterium]|nr:hypothetical protein [Acetobacteraceae bacterium]
MDRWLRELISDYLAVCFVGPVYLLAFDRFILVYHRLDEMSEKYPPVWLRLRVILEALSDGGYLREIEGLTTCAGAAGRPDGAKQSVDTTGDLRQAAGCLVAYVSRWREVLADCRAGESRSPMAALLGVIATELGPQLTGLLRDAVLGSERLSRLRFDHTSWAKSCPRFSGPWRSRFLLAKSTWRNTTLRVVVGTVAPNNSLCH